MSARLCVRNLRTLIEGYGPPIRAVDGVDLDLQAGEILALVGESGCGKTMLALSLTRLLPPGARVAFGSIQFEGTDLAQLPEEVLRSVRGGKIAYLFQDPLTALNPVMTIQEQICESLQLHQNLTGPPARRRSVELLRQVQIPDPERRARQYPHQFSGGMRQRSVLAMALAGRPSLLIADEPTTALDVTTQAEILQLIRNLQKETGMSVLLITHDLMGVASLADRIAVMYAGRIVESAPSSRFYSGPSHPYTQALLACIPKGEAGKKTFESIPGAVPDLRFTPSGCPFHPRCSEVFDKCKNKEPQLRPIENDHGVSCWKRTPDADPN